MDDCCKYITIIGISALLLLFVMLGNLMYGGLTW